MQLVERLSGDTALGAERRDRLPLGTDTLIACAIASSITQHHNVFQLPPVAFGCSNEHAGFLGTVSISATTLAACPDYLRERWQTSDHAARDRRHLTTLGIHAYTPTGVIGSPSQATETEGNKALDHLGRNAATLIELLTAS